MTIFTAVIKKVIDRSMTILLGLKKVRIWPFTKKVIDRSMTIFETVIKNVIDRSMTFSVSDTLLSGAPLQKGH